MAGHDRCWHDSEVAPRLAYVGYRGKSRKHLLDLSLTGFDVVDGARSRHRGAIE
jgi:hypothetical protein